MIYLGQGIYLDMDNMIAYRWNGDGKRPSVFWDGTNPEMSNSEKLEKEVGVKVSVI